MIIAIDGTTSSGKSTLSRALGKKLNFCVLGTGSLYRAIALKMINLNIDKNDNNSIKNMLATTTIESKYINGETIIYVDGLKQENNLLSSHNVSVFTPFIASKEFVREFVRTIQKQMAKENKNIIVEGRDIGSVVFPNADIKLFVDASIEARAKRRLNDYLSQGKKYSLKQVINEIEKRDQQDQTRHTSPLIMTSDAYLIDTTNTTINKAVDKVLEILENKKSD